MRILALLVVSLALFAVACGGGGGSSTPTPTATALPTAAATPEPSGLEIWARSMGVLERVESVHVRRTSGSAYYGYIEATFPRHGRPSGRGITPWREEQPLPLFPRSGPASRRPPTLTNLHLLGTEMREGESSWIVSFDGWESGIDTGLNYTARAWIARDSYLISRIENEITAYVGMFAREYDEGEGPHVVLEYSEYGFGSLIPPTPLPTPAPPPQWLLEPTSGPCNGTVRLRGMGLTPDAPVDGGGVRLIYVTEGDKLERGKWSGPLYADEHGEVDVEVPVSRGQVRVRGHGDLEGRLLDQHGLFRQRGCDRVAGVHRGAL